MKRYLIAAASLFAAAAHAQTIDAFDPKPGIYPTTLALQADGKILIAGNFLAVDTSVRERMARLNADGSVDTTFIDPMIDSEVKAVAVQPDGKILVGGDFDAIGGTGRHSLARLDVDGSLDPTFADPNLNSAVWSIALQSDGYILVAGDFTFPSSQPYTQTYVARFTSAGVLDTSFHPPVLCCNVARQIALQADGHVLVGGAFSEVGGASHFYFARFSSSGAWDSTFPSDADLPAPGAITVAPDGSIYLVGAGTETIIKTTAAGALAGGFTSAQADSSIDSFVLQPNGKIVIAGIFETVGGQPRHGVARLNSNGTLDTSFGDVGFNATPTQLNGSVYGIAEQYDGKIIAITNATQVDGQARQYMARVVTGDAATSTLTATASGSNAVVTWTRSGDGAELSSAPVLEHSSDGTTYSTVGPMTRIAGGWQITAPYNINGASLYLRAHGFANEGAANGSLAAVSSPVYSNDRIFANGFED
jgi:uncharacterized delta-60 repeat protein